MDAKTFLDNFATVTQSPSGVQRTRELIYGLAATGRLIGHTQLGRDGDWPSRPLGDVARLRRGFDLPVRHRADGKVPVYGANGPVGMHDRTPLSGPGVLTGRSGSIGLVHFVHGPYWPLNTALYVQDFFGNEPRWAAILLRGLHLERFSSFSAVPTLNRNVAHKEMVLVPPVADQRRIIARVDELMRLCDDLEAREQRRSHANTRFRTSALRALTDAIGTDDLAKAWQRISANWLPLTRRAGGIADIQGAIRQLAVSGSLVPQDREEEPAAALIVQAAQIRRAAAADRRRQAELERISEVQHVLPSGWSWAQVDDLFLVTGGLQKTSSRRPVKTHFPYLRVANVQRGWLDLAQIERFELLDDELERLRLEVGDLLIVEGNGSESEIGRCARWNGEIVDCVHQNHLIRCRPLLPGIEQYLMLFLNSPAGIQTMKSLAVTTSGLYNLSVGKIRAIQVPVPPLAEQGRILARYRDLMSLCESLAARLAIQDQQRARVSAALTAVS